MTKFFIGLYTCFTSIINAYIIIWASDSIKKNDYPLGALIAIIIFSAFLIGFFRDKLSEIETDKKLSEKDAVISELKLQNSQQQVLIHNIRGGLTNTAVHGKSDEEIAAYTKELASLLVTDPVINNINKMDEIGYKDYMNIINTPRGV